MAIVDNAFREWIADFKATNPGVADSRAILDTAQYAFAAGRKAQRDIDAARQPVGESVARLVEAVEGECNGLTISRTTAKAILAHVFPTGQVATAYMVDGRVEQGLFFDRAAAETMAAMNAGEVVPLFRSPAQAVDLVPAVIPDTPEVRDILGRPNFWCSPWANVLRMRGDAIPNKAEEEQAAVIRFMLNHYLAHGAAWAEVAGDELDAIRKADSQAVGNK